MFWRLISYRVPDIFESMATDEAILLDTVRNKKPPTIRFYGTNPAAVSIGYFQDMEQDIAVEKCRKEGIDIVRRATGGRAVFHLNEITYCVVAPEGEKIFPKDIAGTYKVINGCIARGLGYLGVKAHLAESTWSAPSKNINPCCFAAPAKNELLVDGKKICGSAQMRKRDGFLQHGTLLVSFDARRTASLLLRHFTPKEANELKSSTTSLDEHLKELPDIQHVCEKLKYGFINELGIKLKEDKLTASEEKLKNDLVKKYTSANWNMEKKRKPDKTER